MSVAVRFSSTIWLLVSLLAVFLGCSKNEEPKGEVGAAATVAAAAGQATPGKKMTLIGSGATFPAPLYSRWFREYTTANKVVTVDYQSVGSGQGVKSFVDGRTDFGASDAAMNDEEIAQVDGNVLLLPVTAGSIVLSFNLEGISALKLSRDTYADIFLGGIKKWNDPRIAKDNPDVKLPDQAISVVRRSDGSGTTYVFTLHMSAISEKWKSGPGTGKTVEWPVGVGGKGNEGVTAQIKQTPGAIGYVEYSYAVQNKLSMAALENKSGNFIVPTLESAAAALAAVELPADMRAWIEDPAGENSYPIASYTWILAKKKYDDPAKAEALKAALRWCLTEGQKLAPSLHYIPLPENVVSKVSSVLETIN